MQHAQTVTVLRLSDEVLTEESLRFVHRYLEKPSPPVIHLDLGGVQLPTADGLGALVVLNKELRARGSALLLFNVALAAYEVFVLTKLVEVLAISPSWRQNKDISEPQSTTTAFSLDVKAWLSNAYASAMRPSD
jgi:anti-anti-sigma regulatory factor